MPKKSNPAEYVHRVMTEQNLTARVVAGLAKSRGYKLSRSFIQLILQGRVDNPGIRSLQALSLGLKRPLEEVLAAFGLKFSQDPGKTEVKVVYVPIAPAPVKKTQIGFVRQKQASKK